jgi:DNA-binding response OmpR family regulator
MEERAKILLVEDDVKLAALIRQYLEKTGEFDVEIEARGDRAVERALDSMPDLIILDIMLPGLDGLEVCRRIRPEYPGYILMLTALGDEVDEVVGLELGADDYVAKPAGPRRLLARVRTLLRRSHATQRAGGEDSRREERDKITIGNLCIDDSRRVVTVGDDEVELTTAEYELLFLLARHSGEPLSREQIYKELRGIEWDGLDRSIDLRVTRLRRKLGDDAQNPRRIKAIRGVGYLLAAIP